MRVMDAAGATAAGMEEDVDATTRGGARARMWRYARWQFAEFATQRATIMLLVAGLVAYFFFQAVGSNEFVTREKFIKILTSSMLGVAVPLGTLIAMRGIVSEDRHQGYHRFLFSKPVSVTRYYLQAFLVQATGVMAVAALLAIIPAVLSLTFAQVIPALLVSALFVMLAGGVQFLFSVFSRSDWAWTVFALGVSPMVQGLGRQYEFWWLKAIGWLLPPMDAFGRVVASLLANTEPLAVIDIFWVAAYGAACVAGGLHLLRRRMVAG